MSGPIAEHRGSAAATGPKRLDAAASAPDTPAAPVGRRDAIHAHYDAGQASDLHAGRGAVKLGARGFYLGGRRDDEPETGRRREPQSMVATTVIVGVILAAMGYFLGMH